MFTPALWTVSLGYVGCHWKLALASLCFALFPQSVENCVCVLNNLSFQLEAEAPTLFSRISALAKPISRGQSQSDAGAIGCFSPQSKAVVQEVRQEGATAPGIVSSDDYSADILAEAASRLSV